MRRSTCLYLLMAALMATAGAASVALGAGQSFVADLAGIGDSQAKGQATFMLSEDGMTLHYKVMASNIENATMSHIHLAPAGKDGPVAAWLYPSGPPPVMKEGMFEGTLAEGDITAASLQGDLKGKPLSALIDKIKAGEAYANIHTKQKPGGEVRGQIR